MMRELRRGRNRVSMPATMCSESRAGPERRLRRARAGNQRGMKALVSWEDETGATHRWELAFDEGDQEARNFIEALQLQVPFRLEAFDRDALERRADDAG
jgi:hypothetical protein